MPDSHYIRVNQITDLKHVIENKSLKDQHASFSSPLQAEP